MADYQPLTVPSNYFDHNSNTTPTSSSTHEIIDKESRKRKNRVSTNEAFFSGYQWGQQQQQENNNNNNNNSNNTQKQEWNIEHSATLLPTHQAYSNPFVPPSSSSSSQQQQQQPAFLFDDFNQDPTSHPFFDNYKFNANQQQQQQSMNYSQPTDQFQNLLQSQTIENGQHHQQQQHQHQHQNNNNNSNRSFNEEPLDLAASWNSNQQLPFHGQPSNSRSTLDNSSQFQTDGFFDSLSNNNNNNNNNQNDKQQTNKQDFDLLKFETPMPSDKSIQSLTSPITGSNSTMLLTQHHPPPLSTGGTPPSSPATMPSNQSSPAITPVYGRLSNLSIRQQSTPASNQFYNNNNNTTPLLTPTNGLDIMNDGLQFDTYNNNHNSINHSPQSLHPISTNSNNNNELISTSSTMNYHLNHHHEENNNNNNHSLITTNNNVLKSLPPRNLHAVATARVIQQQATAAKLKPIIQQYLQSKDPISLGEKMVIIMSSKVAQKSYGTEKRFLCPPPTAIVVGSTWWSKKKSNSTSLSYSNEQSNEQTYFKEGQGDTTMMILPPKVTVSISGETSSQAGQIEWYTQANASVVGQTGFPKQQPPSSHSADGASSTNNNSTRFKSHSSTDSKNNGGDWYHNPHMEPIGGGRCVSKQLYINDADEKRKRVECLVKLQIQDQWMGTLAGKGIKVISKPSKKRQSVKNMELCIHHGSAVSLFNRIRSQTVSTKYLGVSTGNASPFSYPGQSANEQTKTNDSTCFVARTTSWDPFIIWLVDTSRPPEQQKFRDDPNTSYQPEDYIGTRSFKPCVNYPPPPAIALRNTSQQPLAIHYNQHVVLQCLTTGLVSPVMIIRKVDKASTVVGGARCIDEPLLVNGGEYGDEMLGDPVSQLHKVALQIVQDASSQSMHQQQQQQQQYLHQQQQQQQNGSDLISGLMEYMLPRYSTPITYLACLNDMVGMHKSTEQRQPILKTPPPPPPQQPSSYTTHEEVIQEDGRTVRKRKVSAYGTPTTTTTKNSSHSISPPIQPQHSNNNNNDPSTFYYNNNNNNNNMNSMANVAQFRRRGNSYDEYGLQQQQLQQQQQQFQQQQQQQATINSNGWINHRARSVSIPDEHRRVSTSSTSSSSTTSWINGPLGGAYWYEDVSDAAVWTLVGIDIASYTFLPPHPSSITDLQQRSSSSTSTSSSSSSSSTSSSSSSNNNNHNSNPPVMSVFPHVSHYSLLQDDLLQLHGDNLSRDMQIWLGDVKIPHMDYKSRELVICRLPNRQELLDCPFIESYTTTASNSLLKTHYQLPLLLVKTADGIVHKTNIYYQF
ncbi:hypothetical protein BJ944DRAFT_127381 [Cunninghamella echinulata]|nr:hypothetical protein BJ944DRAFT_127381 [Cunninghamella echinulata]